MFNALIRLALGHRLITLGLAVVLSLLGAWTWNELPLDVLPDLNRPRVTILTEAPGYAPEEVESLITFPLEQVLQGGTGVLEVRSTSTIGLSLIYVEFDWGADVRQARQLVNEKLAQAADRLPPGIRPQLTPMASILGQVLQIGLWSRTGETDAVELRTLADWVVRQRLLTIPGVAQVTTMGGGRKQYHVLVNPEALATYDVTLAEVEQAIAASNVNATGGYLDQGGTEFLVRSLGRIDNPRELAQVVVKPRAERSILLAQVARIEAAPQVKRGEAAIDGVLGVLLVITKQPGADTRRLTDDVSRALAELAPTLPADVQIDPAVFRQQTFIDLSISNVIEALRDGSLLVVIVLLLFLMNARTTIITLTAIPLSILITGLVFRAGGLSINTMTLGGLAVAIGELVDDAIVDVENVFRRLRENRQLAEPRPTLRVVFDASCEVRSSIVFSTLLVVLVFVPLLALEGIEGRLFRPLALAYIISILASLLVSLTVTPVLAHLLLSTTKHRGHERDGWLLTRLKRMARPLIRMSIRRSNLVLVGVALLVAASVVVVTQLGTDFLPPFNEGSIQVNVMLPPGTSLAAANRAASAVELRLKRIEGVTGFGRRTGRAELDEHAEEVCNSEIIVNLDPHLGRKRDEVLAEIRRELNTLPGLVVTAEQPLQHLISHMLSGVRSPLGVKIFGDDLNVLRTQAERVRGAIADVPGLTDLFVEQQVEIPQLQLRLDRERLARYGLSVATINHFISTAMQGSVATEVIEGARKFEVVVRFDEPFRHDLEYLRRLAVPVPGEGRVPLGNLAEMVESSGPNQILRERARRRIVVQANIAGRDAGHVAQEVRARLDRVQAELPAGYALELTGQFASQQSAARSIGLLGLFSLVMMFMALFALFGSANLALQVLAALPMAAIGAVGALIVTGQSLTVASMVGFVSLSGIASRNGILLLAHYRHLMEHEGETFSPEMIERAGLERLAPMLMTALTAGVALIPLVLAADEPGKEILYPVATVIVGGLISSTLLDLLVHPALYWRWGRRSLATSADSLVEPRSSQG